VSEREVGNSLTVKALGKSGNWSQLARLNYDLYHTTSAIETATVAANVLSLKSLKR
jgi:hypothetical protein